MWNSSDVGMLVELLFVNMLLSFVWNMNRLCLLIGRYCCLCV